MNLYAIRAYEVTIGAKPGRQGKKPPALFAGVRPDFMDAITG